MNINSPRKKQGTILIVTGLGIIVISIAIPVIYYFIEMPSCRKYGDFCGFGSAYLATFIGIPGCLLGIILLLTGLFKKWRASR